MTAYDFEQAFDSLWLQDCVLSLQKIGVPVDILHLIYNLNKNAKITVNTPYGITHPSLLNDVVEQGTVLGPILCSTSTAEYCESNIGVAVHNSVVSSLLWVDDALDLSLSSTNAEISHENALFFGRKKKLTYSRKKCNSMVINGRKKDIPPNLYIEDIKMEIVKFIEYLGDVINSKGDFSDLVDDRLKRGIVAMIRIEALVRETGLGVHTVNVHLLLYQSLFISCLLFNSQAWGNMKDADFERLEKLQLKCLKKILQLPQSTANSFVYLEFGELPIRYMIDRNQLIFLHHIIHLDIEDPVRVMLEKMKKFVGERNWWNRVEKLLVKYRITQENVQNMSRDSYKELVKKRVRSVAFASLMEQCGRKEKTKELIYKALSPQEYLSQLYPNQARAIIQGRSKTLSIKEHRPYAFKDMVCRRCKKENETLNHVVNCGYEHEINACEILDSGELSYERKLMFTSIALRINNFIEEVKT